MTDYTRYQSYDIRSHFKTMPPHIQCCLICGSKLTSTDLQFSKVCAEDMRWKSLIPGHIFTKLFHCTSCSWWCIREHWGFFETANCFYDYLIVGIEPDEDGFESRDNRPWFTALKDEHVYKDLLPLSNDLIRLFPPS